MNITKLAWVGVLAFSVTFGQPAVAHAGDGGTGSTCSLAHVSVTKQPSQTLYVYEVDCPGQPFGWFGGGATARYQVIGNWNPHTRTAHDNVFSFDRNQGVLDTWTCNDDPWITAAGYPGEGGWPNAHSCQLQRQRGGDDWTTDTNPTTSFGSTMCFNDLWGARLAGCWGNDDTTVTGLSAAIVRAWNKA